MSRSPKSGRRARVRQAARRPRPWKLGWERLEDLTLLSAILYIDYGDNFAGGVLQGADINVGNLFSHTAAGGANVNGPQLTDAADDDFADATSVMLASFSNFYAGVGKAAAEIAEWRTAITAMVRRVYAPFDVTVIDLSAAGTTVNGQTVAAAADFDDVSTTLAASGGKDSYVFVAQAIIGGTVADATTDPTQFVDNGYGGKASGLDIGKNNDNVGTALSLLRSDYGTNKVAQTIAHEAGHLFGMAHAWRGDQGDDPDPRDSLGDYKDQLDLYHRFETMSYLAFSGFSAFSRVPITADKVLDGGKFVANLDPAVLNAIPNPYEHFKADPNVGVSAIEYVTGTGAHDVVTIARTGATTALVTIEPFFDATYTTAINIPGQATAIYSYSIDTTKPIVVDGGSGNDRFVIDADLGTAITIRGDSWSGDPGDKADTLVVRGKGAAAGVYLPGTNDDDSLAGGDDLRGRIVVGTTIIDFQEFNEDGGVTVSDVQNFVFRTPAAPVGGSGGNDLTIDSPEAGRNRVGRFGSTSGVDVVPLTFFDVSNFTIDTATNDAASPDDTITVGSPGLVAAGLRNLTISTGAGDDTLIVAAGADFGLPVAGGAFTYNAGPQATPGGDDLLVHAPGASTGQFRPDGATAGSGRFIEDGTTLFTTGLERATIDGFADFALVASNDGDVMTITPSSGFMNRIVGSSGGVAFSALSFYDVTDFLVDSRSNNVGGLLGDRYTIDNPGGRALVATGLRNFTIRSSAGHDVLTVNAADFRLPNGGGEFLFDAGTGAGPGSNLRGLISLDRVVVEADVDFLLTETGAAWPDRTHIGGLLSIAAAGSGQAGSALLGSLQMIGVEGASLTGGGSGNLMNGSGFSGTLFLDGRAGDDVLIGGPGDNELVAGDGDDLMIVGRDAFATPGVGSQNHVILRGGGTNVLRGGPGRNTFRVDLDGTSTLIGGAGENLYIITNPPGGMVAPVGGIEVVGTAAAEDVLRLVGGGGEGYNQTYLLGPVPGAGNIVTTNNHVPDGPTISQFVRFSGIDAIDDTIAVESLVLLGESPSAPIGGVSGADLALGLLNPTVGGLPFGAITVMNKTDPAVQLADGQVVRPPLPPGPLPFPLAPAPLVIATPAPPPAATVAIAPIAPATVAAEPPTSPAPAPIAEPPARPGFARRLAAGRSFAARRLPRPAFPRPTFAARGALARPAARPPAFRPFGLAPRGPLAHLRRA